MTLLLNTKHTISQHHVYDDVYNALTNLVPHIYVELWLRTVLDWEMEGEESLNPFEAKYSHKSSYPNWRCMALQILHCRPYPEGCTCQSLLGGFSSYPFQSGTVHWEQQGHTKYHHCHVFGS